MNLQSLSEKANHLREFLVCLTPCACGLCQLATLETRILKKMFEHSVNTVLTTALCW